MELLTVLVLVGTAAGLRHWVRSRRTVALLDLLGQGFLPYRSEDGWPQGVQEADPVPWSWSSPEDADQRTEALDAGAEDGEIVEVTRGVVPTASPVRRGRLVAGSASRPH